MNYQEIITIEPGKRGGKPCIRGMRITVYDVLEYLASGMSQQEVLDDFPYLTEEDIRACLAYAADCENAWSFSRHETPFRPKLVATSCQPAGGPVPALKNHVHPLGLDRVLDQEVHE